MDKILQERVNLSEWMVYGLNGNKNKLSKRGLDDDFIERYHQTICDIKELGRELENLKTVLEEKNKRLETALDDLNKFYMVTMKIVKLDLPKEKWLEFGIKDPK